jgi:hypothetical protein
MYYPELDCRTLSIDVGHLCHCKNQVFQRMHAKSINHNSLLPEE